MINDVAYSGNGRWIAIGTTTGVYIHDAQDLNELPRWIPTNDPVNKVIFSPDGSLIATSLPRQPVHIWQVETGTLLNTIPNEADDMIFSPDGQFLAIIVPRYQQEIQLWRIGDGVNVHTFRYATAIAFMPDQLRYAVAFNQNRSTYISTYALSENNVLSTLQIESCENCLPENIASLAFSPDGQLIIMGKGLDGEYNNTGVVEVRRIENAEVIYRIDTINTHPDRPYVCDSPFVGFEAPPRPSPGAIRLSPDNKQFSIIYTEKGGIWTTVKSYRLSDGQLLHTFVEGANSLAFSPDSLTIVTGSKEGRVQIWQSEGFNLITNLEGYDPAVSEIKFSPDGQLLATEHRNSVRLRRVMDGALLDEFKTAVKVAFSPDSKQYALGFVDGHIEVFNAMSGELQYEITYHIASISQLMFTPDSQMLVSMAQDCTMIVWQAANGAFLRPLEDYVTDTPVTGESRIRVDSIIVAPDGKKLIGSFDAVSSFGVWQLNDGSLLGVFPDGFEVGIHNLVIVPGSKTFAAVGGTHSLVSFSFWQIEGAILIKEWEKPDRGNYYLQEMTFSPDATVVASASNQGTLELWSVDGEQHLITLNFDTFAYQVDVWFFTSVAFSPNGRFLATGSSDGLVRLWGVP